MQTRQLGNSGLQVSLVGLGCNNFGGRIDLAESQKVVHRALDLGITLLDTADVYGKRGGSEEILGEVLGARRKDVVLATKFANPMDNEGKLQGGSRRYIMSAVEASLRRMKTDWIDLYQIHAPDPLTPIEETMRTLDDLVRQGKVRYIGCSKFAGWELMESYGTARQHGLQSFISTQAEYSLLVREPERELIPAMRRAGCSLLPFFPLASGFLSGKYDRNAPLPGDSRMKHMAGYSDRFMTERNWQIVDALRKFCDQRKHSLLELAFSWLVAQPAVGSVIAGATKPEQVEQNVRAADWVLSADELKEIDSLAKPG